MDVAQQFCLRWNNYQSTLHHVFHKLWVNKMFVDVCLVVEGRKIECHKVILSACSTYFESLLSEHCSHPHPLILLHDIPLAAIESLVTFMYKGEINVSHDQLTALLKAAEALKIKGLADSSAISNFTKYQLVSPDITHVSSSSYPQTVVPPPAPTSAIPASTSSSFMPQTTGNIAMSKYSTPLSVIKEHPAMEQVKRNDNHFNGPSHPHKKRLRLEEVESLPPSPPISLGDTHNNEPSRTSPQIMEQEHKIKIEDDYDSDKELQIDEGTESSPSELASNGTVSSRNTPVLDPDTQDLVERHETAQSLAALACQGAINLLPQVQHHVLAPRPSSTPLQIKEERLSSSGSAKNTERTYTLQDLEDGIEAVLKGFLTPAKAIARYKIPRRTFFRRLSAVRKSRGILSSKENADLLSCSASGKQSQSLKLPNLVSANSTYPALTKLSKISTDNIKLEKKTPGLNLTSGNVFSLLNVAANPNYDYYFKYLKLTQTEDKKDIPIIDSNRNLSGPDIVEQPLTLVTQNNNNNNNAIKNITTT